MFGEHFHVNVVSYPNIANRNISDPIYCFSFYMLQCLRNLFLNHNLTKFMGCFIHGNLSRHVSYMIGLSVITLSGLGRSGDG